MSFSGDDSLESANSSTTCHSSSSELSLRPGPPAEGEESVKESSQTLKGGDQDLPVVITPPYMGPRPYASNALVRLTKGAVARLLLSQGMNFGATDEY